jgi:hypothetical protein
MFHVLSRIQFPFDTVNLFHAEFYLAQRYILCNYSDSAMIFDDKRGNVSLLSRL